VLGVAAVLSLFTSLLFGLLPAWRAARVDPAMALASVGGRSSGETRGAARIRQGLLIVEIACSVVLLICTIMLAQSFSRLLTSARSLGAVPVTMVEVDHTGQSYPGGSGVAMAGQILAALRALPGVHSAATTSVMPLTGDMANDQVVRPDHPLPPGHAPLANLRVVSPGFFTTLGIRIVAGRAFTDADISSSRGAIISEATAREAWPHESPLGHTILQFKQIYRVVGVSADARLNDPKKDVPMFYIPMSNASFESSTVFLLRGTGISGPEIRRAIWSVDPQLSIPTLLPLHVQTEKALAVDRFQTILVALFGLTGLLLTALGVYGVLSYGVNLRMREWGLRMALGSSRQSLLARLLLQAGKPVLLGAALGGVAAVGAEQWLRSLLYEAAPNQAGPVIAALLVLLVVALIAALPPAFRAASSDPAEILRAE
jgi:putative ABC transport system permease protein